MSQPTRRESQAHHVAPFTQKSWLFGDDVFCDVCGEYLGFEADYDVELKPHEVNGCLIYMSRKIRSLESEIEDLKGRNE